ncbi:MAG: ABC transporter ATP-binding protein [Armatimonadota bacterium]
MIQLNHVEKRFYRPDEPPLCWTVDELAIAKGERVLVNGPSGCGKTTLLNLTAGLLQADSGEITVNDERIDEMSISELDFFRGEHIGLVFQSFQLLSMLTVMENILLGARYGRKWTAHEARDHAKVLLQAVGLADRHGHRPAQLSLGEQQRVAIARALINEPPLLLADEPTASLDATNAVNVLDLLFTLCETHQTTLVTISHDRSIAQRFDRTIDATPWMTVLREEVAHV